MSGLSGKSLVPRMKLIGSKRTDGLQGNDGASDFAAAIDFLFNEIDPFRIWWALRGGGGIAVSPGLLQNGVMSFGRRSSAGGRLLFRWLTDDFAKRRLRHFTTPRCGRGRATAPPIYRESSHD